MDDGTLGLIALFLLFIAVGISNSPDQFNPNKNVCMSVSGTIYTNVGTPVLGTDGKPIACIPNTN